VSAVPNGADAWPARDLDRLDFDPGSVFDPVASNYQDVRPGYPEALFDALERIVGRLQGRRVLDVGAGTGISTRSLASRGARVVAVDPSLAMAGVLRAVSPQQPATLGRAEALPVGSGLVELVTFAQAWHWVHLPAAAVECRRVLGEGGRLALWWNVSQDESAFHDQLRSDCGISRYGGREHQDDEGSLVEIGGFASVTHDSVRWEWRVSVEHWLATAATRSELAKLGEASREQLRAIETVVRRHFPDGQVSEWFTTRLTVATA
jgi:SAM-dependent methyltransferase